MRVVREASQFRRDAKLARKRGLNVTKLQEIIDLLVIEQPLPPKNKDHILTGNWYGHRECHIEPDWLLIYKIEDGGLELVRTGSHTDLFD